MLLLNRAVNDAQTVSILAGEEPRNFLQAVYWRCFCAICHPSLHLQVKRVRRRCCFLHLLKDANTAILPDLDSFSVHVRCSASVAKDVKKWDAKIGPSHADGTTTF